MTCPFCGNDDSKVVDSRDAGDSIRRRRECTSCTKRFTTHERIERRLPTIVKKGGSKEIFERDKIFRGLALACRKRPVPGVLLEAAAERIEQRLASWPEREIDSRDVGQLVLDELLALDRVAYLRFASVYQELGDPQEFYELLKPLLADRT